ARRKMQGEPLLRLLSCRKIDYIRLPHLLLQATKIAAVSGPQEKRPNAGRWGALGQFAVALLHQFRYALGSQPRVKFLQLAAQCFHAANVGDYVGLGQATICQAFLANKVDILLTPKRPAIARRFFTAKFALQRLACVSGKLVGL